MKDESIRRTRLARRAAALTFLLTVALASTAQTPLLDSDTPARETLPANASALDTFIATRAVPDTRLAAQASTALPLKPNGPALPAAFDVATFESIAQQMVADQRVPGMAMAIVHKGQILSARGYGITDVSDAQPVDSHTVFRLASLSKGFAGTMAGLLVNNGTLRWDSHLTDYVPEFRMSQPGAAQQITVADILSHRVGLGKNAYDRDLEGYVSYRDLSRKLASAPMKCAPGTCYAYQNVAFSLIGDIVFASTGDFYSQEVTRRLLKPLGMNDASLGLEGIESSARWAKPHVRGKHGWVSVMPKLDPAKGGSAMIPSAGLLTMSVSADDGWKLTVNGRAAKPVTIDGWQQGFLIPSAGKVQLSHETPPLRWAMLFGQVLIWAAVVTLWRRSVRRKPVDVATDLVIDVPLVLDTDGPELVVGEDEPDRLVHAGGAEIRLERAGDAAASSTDESTDTSDEPAPAPGFLDDAAAGDEGDDAAFDQAADTDEVPIVPDLSDPEEPT